MGGDNSPNKTIEGVILNHRTNKNLFYKIFGDENKISPTDQ
jgi:glycerol-3-phosphate acyltransferase PlsX